MARVYATPAEYEAYTGQSPAPAGTDRRLRDASRMLDSQVFRLCWYEVNTEGMPTHPLVLTAFSDAACAQAQWWDALGGDTTGADAVGWGSVEIGSVKLGRSVTAVSGDDAPARQLAPQVWDSLRSPDLTGDIFRLGEVVAW